MTSDYTEYLITVLQRTFSTLFGLEINLVERQSKESKRPAFEISGVIGITGPKKGGLVVSFPKAMALELTARMLGEDPDEVSVEDMCDCVGEIANIVGGNLLPTLTGSGDEGHGISLPSMVMGTHRVIWRTKDTPCDFILLGCDLGQFSAELSLKAESEAPAPVKKKGPSRFLLVDDSRVMRRVVQKCLKEAGFDGSEFVEANDGEAAVEELNRRNYDVDAIICDCNMPNLDGIGFLDHLKSVGKLEDCPVVMITGDISDGRGEEAVSRGASQWVPKPFTPDVLGKAVRAALGMD